MSLASLMAADVSDVFLNTSEHAETITHIPYGVSDVEVTAVVERLEPIPRDGFTIAQAKVYIASSVCVGKRDAFFFNDRRYDVVRFEEPEAGLRVVYVERRDGEWKGAETGRQGVL